MKKPLVTFATFFACLFVIGIVFVFQGNKDKSIAKKEPIDIDDLSYINCQKDAHIRGEIYACFGPYAEEYETRYFVKSSDSTYYYFIPVGDKNYISISTSSKDLITKLDNLVNATYDYLDGVTDDIYAEPIEFNAKVVNLDKKIEGYLYDFLYKIGYEQTTPKDELKATFLGNYKLVSLGEADRIGTMIYIGGFISLIGLVGLIIMIAIILNQRKKSMNTVYNSYSTPSYVGNSNSSYNNDFSAQNQYQPPQPQQTQNTPSEQAPSEPPVMPSLSFTMPEEHTDADSQNNTKDTQ